MLKKRLVLFNFLLIAALVLSGCAQAPAGDDAADARIAELEAALAEAAAAGGSTADELAAMKSELDGLTGELGAAEFSVLHLQCLPHGMGDGLGRCR